MGRIYPLAQPQESSFQAAQKAHARPEESCVEHEASLEHLSNEDIALLIEQQKELGFATMGETLAYLSTYQLNRIKQSIVAQVPPRAVKGGRS